jgi:hypothetical protein
MARVGNFYERLKGLGFQTYAAYLRSPHWLAFKAAYHRENPDAKCLCCWARPVQLHHHDYTNLGGETFEDVTPLCGGCHKGLHDLLKEARRSVSFTEWAVERLRGCLWIQRRLLREERREADAAARVKVLRETRAAYARFYSSLPKEAGRPPKSQLRYAKRRKG